MSLLNVNAIEPSTGTDITLGASGDTTTVPSGATIVNSGTATGFGGVNTPYSIYYDTGGFASAQSIAASTQTEITAWDAGDINNAGGASYSAGRITLGTAAKYLVTCAVQIESIEADKEVRLRIGVDGTTQDCARIVTGIGGGANISLTGAVGVTLTDANYVSFFIFHSDGSARDLSSGNFSIIKVIE